ncbi:M23 family metallopeptidase [Elongatibacter sediminis]|uniref:M23 family metallopeptidase n=1 Tax=Elongatibacter sediminis TaxID=3119006 RepID=A0AAW9RF74_9GAMM
MAPVNRRISIAAALLLFAAFCLCTAPGTAWAVTLEGEAIQGGLIFGQARPGSEVDLDGQPVMVSGDGRFVLGFGRDETGTRTLSVIEPGEEKQRIDLPVRARDYAIERVDGLPPRTVTPDPAAAQRIREEAALVSSARSRRDSRTDYAEGFAWPAEGRISGVYGSQRILNGEPRRPHYGLDIAAPTGTPVHAPAAGIVTLAHPDMYYSGGTLILDHGQGLSSTFLHLSRILVEAGMTVEKGDVIAEIGATGRASGPHLDWRMNWMDRRVDPRPLVPELPPSDGAAANPR